VGSGELSRSVKRFIGQHISSVEQLEILLLLRGDPAVEWRPESVARELYFQTESVLRRLDDLAGRGFLRLKDGCYRYAPRTADLGGAVEELADTYARRRVKVITQIFSGPDQAVQSFSDAFRITKDR
jgi:hypothetical protein